MLVRDILFSLGVLLHCSSHIAAVEVQVFEHAPNQNHPSTGLVLHMQWTVKALISPMSKAQTHQRGRQRDSSHIMVRVVVVFVISCLIPSLLPPGHGLMSAEAQSGILEDLPAVLDRMAPEDFVRESQGPGISNLAILGGQSTRAAKKAAALQNENRPVRVATPRHFARGGSASNGPLMTMRAQLQRGPSLDPRRDSTSAASDLSMANDQDVADAVSQFDTRHCEMQLDE